MCCLFLQRLQLECEYGTEESVKECIELGANVNYKDPQVRQIYEIVTRQLIFIQANNPAPMPAKSPLDAIIICSIL